MSTFLQPGRCVRSLDYAISYDVEEATEPLTFGHREPEV